MIISTYGWADLLAHAHAKMSGFNSFPADLHTASLCLGVADDSGQLLAHNHNVISHLVILGNIGMDRGNIAKNPVTPQNGFSRGHT
mmetsp:Transcript_9400/g.15077  ORF Transcript_9400/g.15077 Transcript_9400/m.15077 type:complete len:86 (-) Transcript_9400:309-566(-)